MRSISKKMLISILTSVVVFVTMIATTFAWVGIFTYANTDKFNINLKVQELDVNYFLTISATGQKNDFSDEANISDIKKQILKNQNKWSNEFIDGLNNKALDELYSRNSYVTPSTVNLNNEGFLEEFKAIDMGNTNYFSYYSPKVPYLKFDLYLSVNTKEGIQETSIINSNVYLTELLNTLEGTVSEYKLYNGNQFSLMPSTDPVLSTLPTLSYFKVNSKNACRFALNIFNPIDINEQYNTNYYPTKTYIYQGGTQNPTKDGDVFNLGGNLPEDYNTALLDLLVIRPNYKNNNLTYLAEYENALNSAIERGQHDLELLEENSKIWYKPSNPSTDSNSDSYGYNYLGVQDGIQTKMKIEVIFWFEGWDSDCLAGINEKPVTMNLKFTPGIID